MSTLNPPPVLAVRETGDIDVFALLLRLWRRRYLALLFLAVALCAGIFYLRVVEYRYSAELAVTPVDQSGPKLSGGLAALGSLAGIDPAMQGGSSFALYGEAATSYPIAERLARNPRILHAAFASQWDPVGHQWIRPSGFLTDVVGSAKVLFGLPIRPWTPPAAGALHDYLKKNLELAEDKKKALLRISFRHPDPKFAVYLLQQVAATADEYLRAKSLNRATIYVTYLETRMNQVQVAEYRTSLAQALIGYENTRMMASSRAPFAAEPFGDIWVSSRPVTPDPFIILGTSVAVGLVAWIAFVFIADAIGSKRRALREPVIVVATIVDSPDGGFHPATGADR